MKKTFNSNAMPSWSTNSSILKGKRLMDNKKQFLNPEYTQSFVESPYVAQMR
ncbi:hypothetical protein GKD03_05670, partial [Lactobacillus rhamnosus]|nr:hypothetical protein [Lacticaseibacillus rhamnosus]